MSVVNAIRDAIAAKRILWLDLETTGLDPLTDQILEVGVIITDGRLKELTRAEWAIKAEPGVIARMPDVVQVMHAESGLTARCLGPLASTLDGVQGALLTLFKMFNVDKTTFLAGNSVGDFDRHFMRLGLNRVNAAISHRSINVSTFKALCSIWAPEIALPQVTRTKAHRSLMDCEHAIRELRYWLDACEPERFGYLRGPYARYSGSSGGGFPGYVEAVK